MTTVKEQVALQIGRQAVAGVRRVPGRGDGPAAAAGVYPLPPAGADEAGAPAGDRLAAALAAARAGLSAGPSAVLALPTDGLLVKVLALPPADAASIGDIVRLQMEKVAPFAGEEMVVAHEELSRDAQGVRVFAAAAPLSALDTVAAAAKAAGLAIARLDVALLGTWRQLAEAGQIPQGTARRAFLLADGDAWDLLLADGPLPVLARGLGVPSEPVDVACDLTQSLLDAELAFGSQPLAEVIVVAPGHPRPELRDALAAAAGVPIHHLPPDRLGQPGSGAVARAAETGRLDLVPAAWRKSAAERVVRDRFVFGLGLAAAVWVLLLAGLLLTPLLLRQATDRRTAELRALTPAATDVRDTRTRVRLIRSYLDRSRSLLEVLRTACTVLPDGIDLGSVTYRREEGMKLVGDAADPSLVYALKDALDADGTFAASTLSGPTFDPARRRHRFEIDARFPEARE